MNSFRTGFLALILLVGATFAQAQPAAAGAKAPHPVADYARYPDYHTARLSRSGRYLAVLRQINGRSNLAVIDLSTRSSNVLTSIERFDVLEHHWLEDERLVFTLGEKNTPSGSGQFDGGGLFVVSRDGTESRQLAPTRREMRQSGQNIVRRMRFVATIPGNDREIIVAENARTVDGDDLYRVDVTTGRKTLLTADRPERVFYYILDRSRVARIAISSVKGERLNIVWQRESEASQWTEVARIDGAAVGDKATIGFAPLAFDNDNKTLVVASNQGRDTMALFRYDPNNKRLGELIAGHPRYDMGANLLGGSEPGLYLGRQLQILGYEVEGERWQSVWTDESLARLQASIDRALPNRVNQIERAESGRVLVLSYSDQVPLECYVYDQVTAKLQFVIAGMPRLTAEHLVEVRPFTLKARDGLELPSYYLLPPNHKVGERLPTVVYLSGGTHSVLGGRTNNWGPPWLSGYGIAEAQLLASRGYAVILATYRGSTGLGTRVYDAGRRALGRAMSEDHEDAAKWAADQGFADPSRICISGVEYGGYAALRALGKTPDLFKCGIAGFAISDLELHLTSTAGNLAYSAVGQRYLLEVLIGEDKFPGITRAISPIHQISQIKAPIFLYAGAQDTAAPVEQTRNMVSALRAAGQSPEVLVKPDEGHGFGKLENRTELWEKMLDFLDRHIGSRARPQ